MLRKSRCAHENTIKGIEQVNCLRCIALSLPLAVTIAAESPAWQSIRIDARDFNAGSNAESERAADCSGVSNTSDDESDADAYAGYPWGDALKLSDDASFPLIIGGWTQVGYHTNNNGLFNCRPHQVQLQEQCVYAEKDAKAERGLDYGFRVDAVYGTDGQDFQSFGGSPSWFDNPWDGGRDYGWALPQVYVEVVAGDLSVLIGHFFSLIGYEYGTAPDNFFYSHTYTFFHSEPFTHTGFLATYAVSQQTDISFGWVDGWDTGFEFTGGNQFLGGINHSIGETIKVHYACLVGDRERGSVDAGGGYNHSLVIETRLTDKLDGILQYDLTDYSRIDDHDYGVNQRFIYAVNDRVACGIRVEWWHTPAECGTRSDIYALTLGMNLRPQARIVLRPEIRWDWNRDGALGIAQAGLGAPVNRLNGDLTFAIDAVLSF